MYGIRHVGKPGPCRRRGSGHYFPGSMSSFMNGVSTGPLKATRLNVIDYDGSVGAMREIPTTGFSVPDASVKSQAHGLTL